MIIFDLDGPILDVSQKYYELYRDILVGNNDEPLSKNDYWSLKRAKVPNRIILNNSNANITNEKYMLLWMENIETKKYQKFDEIQNGGIYTLENLINCRDLVLITLRSSRKSTIDELKRLKLYDYFLKIYTPEKESIPRWKMKKEIIEKYIISKLNKDSIMIGDTETDIIAGEKTGIRTVAISNGIRNSDVLIKEKPNHIFSNILEFYKWFDQYE